MFIITQILQLSQYIKLKIALAKDKIKLRREQKRLRRFKNQFWRG